MFPAGKVIAAASANSFKIPSIAGFVNVFGMQAAKLHGVGGLGGGGVGLGGGVGGGGIGDGVGEGGGGTALTAAPRSVSSHFQILSSIPMPVLEPMPSEHKLK